MYDLSIFFLFVNYFETSTEPLRKGRCWTLLGPIRNGAQRESSVNCTLAVLGSFRLYWCPVCKHHLALTLKVFLKVHGQMEDDHLLIFGGGVENLLKYKILSHINTTI